MNRPSPAPTFRASRYLFASLLVLAASRGLFVGVASADPSPNVHAYPVPPGVPASKDFTATADGVDLPIYLANVAPADDQKRAKAMDDHAHPDDNVDHASFAPFDMKGAVTVVVTCPQAVHSVRVLPTSYHIEVKIEGQRVTIPLAEPRNLTVEVNGDWVHSLHLFASPIETNVPRSGDANVIYFGPGVHEVTTSIQVSSGKTLYLAAGAVLRAVGSAADGPVVGLVGDHAAVRGRGIIDGSACPLHTRNLLLVHGRDVKVDGVILNDSSTWNVPIRQSDQVLVTNLKILGCRANSDGIDICNSRDVTVDGCFLRTLDDLVVVKAVKDQGEVHHVLVKNCVLWNQVAHALSVGAEVRENIDDVHFTNCDVIHDTGREWLLRIYHCDAATVSNVVFDAIRVEESRRFISVWIGKQMWSRDAGRGNVRAVTFKDIHATTPTPPALDLEGFDAAHDIEGVTFEHVVVDGRSLLASQIKTNPFVKNVVVRP